MLLIRERTLPHKMAEHTSLLSVEPSHTSIAFEQPVKSDDTIKHQQGPTWRPVSLRNATLLTFASVYTLMFVCLAVLAWISLKQHGVCAVRIHDRYWWTYGPTASTFSDADNEISITYEFMVSSLHACFTPLGSSGLPSKVNHAMDSATTSTY